ncbi:MAG: mono/diheme cytochrome c family protein [Bacteroidia bacterium]|jgi:mono/diheme cytochrome c family protein
MNFRQIKASAVVRGFFGLLLTVSVLASGQAKAQDGEKLFKQNCASCHRVDGKALTGPGLAGVYDRVPQPADEWLLKWVKNSNAVIKSGDAYAVALFNEYNKTAMTNFEFLSDEEVVAILDYVKNPPAPKEAVVADAGAGGAGGEPEDDSSKTYMLAMVAVMLLLLISILTGVKRNLDKVAHDRQGLPEPTHKYGMAGLGNWASAHKGWVAIFGLCCVLFLIKVGFDAALTIGVYQGYKPEQPIAFSHKIHAGQNGIQCVYCHSSALKGKTSGIPSLNVCMNCHAYVDEGPSGKKEIAKIYNALDYDYDTKKYGDNPTPVKWVRVHNLPDLAYFNHSQHVVVGGLECETCHGDVKNMDEAEQHSELTMGWCIDCHRTEAVKIADNGYYEDLLSRMPDVHHGEVVTVETIGGLECAKCHY